MVREAFLRRKEEIDRAVVAESARWGDSKTGAPLTRNTNWISQVNQILNSHIPARTNNVIAQLRAWGLYPAFGAPLFNQRGGTVAPGFALTMTTAPSTPATATIYYTLDGSDPRRLDGTLNPNAIAYTEPVVIDGPMTVRARALNDTGTTKTWSPIAESTFSIDTVPLRITEVMYNPEPPVPGGPFGRQEYEFIELQNVGTTELDLSGVRFTDGVGFTFPDGTTLAPGAYTLVARNPDAIAERYGNLGVLVWPFTGGLSDSGERIALAAPGDGIGGAGGPTLLEFTYSDAWEPSTDGDGRSLVIRNAAGVPESWKVPESWRRSAALRGSPGAADPVIPATVAGRWVYYNKSGYDGTAPAGADSSDDNARAADKVALLPGQGRATFANVTTYVKGINGLFVDLADLPPGQPITAADFEFNVAPGNDPTAWAAAPAPTLVAIRRGAGVGGSDRVTLTWADNVIKNAWLQVTVKANEHTGLAAPDVFYFGNLAGETGDAPAAAPTLRVNALDLSLARRGPLTTNAFINNPLDFDRDGKVNALDLAAVRAGLTRSLVMLDTSAPPPGGGAALAAAVAPTFSSAPVTPSSHDDELALLGAAPQSLFA
jgi:hypothetical protein